MLIRETNAAFKNFLKKLAHPNPTMALFSLIIEILGFVVFLTLLYGFVYELKSQLQTKTVSEAFNTANTASFIGYLIILTVFAKNIGADLYDLIWSGNDLYEIELMGPNDLRLVYFLRGIKETYLRYLRDVGRSNLPSVRLNIMIPQTQDNTRAETLKIVFTDYFDDFYEAEIYKEYLKGEAKCGQAWKEKRQTVFDADITSKETRFEPMSIEPSQEKLLTLKSVLSTPVLWRNEIIAIINFDSYQGGKETLVNSVGVKTIFNEAAREIVPLLAILYVR